MLNLEDPKPTWNHQVSPTSPSSTAGERDDTSERVEGRSPPMPGGSEFKVADVSTSSVELGRAAVTSTGSEDVFAGDQITAVETGSAQTEEDDDRDFSSLFGSSPPSLSKASTEEKTELTIPHSEPKTDNSLLHSSPPPLPPYNDLTVTQERLRNLAIRPQLPRLATGSSVEPSEVSEVPEQSEFLDARGNPIWLPPPVRPTAEDAATPTPTSANFREMLESYEEIPETEIPNLIEMANRIIEARVQAAREDQRKFYDDSGRSSGEEAVGESQEETAAKEDLQSFLEGLDGMPVEEAERLVEMVEPLSKPWVRAAREEVRAAWLTEAPVMEKEEETAPRMVTPPSRRKQRAVAEIRAQSMDIRVHMLLHPAKLVFQRSMDENAALPSVKAARKAAYYARKALEVAQTTGIVSADDVSGRAQDDVIELRKSQALQGKCAYYIAIAEWVVAVQREIENDGEGNGVVPDPQYFQLAQQATDGEFVEIEWAREWVAYLKLQQEDASSESPTKDKASGWRWLLRRMTGAVVETDLSPSLFRSKPSTLGNSVGEQEIWEFDDTNEQVSRRSSSSDDDRQNFRQWESLVDVLSSSEASLESREASDDENHHLPDHVDRAADGVAPLPSSFATPFQEDQALPSPVTASQRRPTSIAFEKPTSPNPSSPKPGSIYERGNHVRRASDLLAALVTGREKRMSELETAEGHSPFGGTFFGDEADENGGLKRRRISQEPEDMV